METCHPLLQDVLLEAINRTPMDFTILDGHRTEAEQNAAFEAGYSKARFPDSKHNSQPAMAVDVAPWFATPPNVRWGRLDEFRWLAGFIMGIGAPMVEPRGYQLRWGGDFNMDGDHTNSGFVDLPHIELVPL